MDCEICTHRFEALIIKGRRRMVLLMTSPCVNCVSQLKQDRPDGIAK